MPELAEWQSRAAGPRHRPIGTWIIRRAAFSGSLANIVPVARADAATGRSAYGASGLDSILLDPTGEAATAFGVIGFPTGIPVAADGHIASSALTGAQAIIEHLSASSASQSTP